MQKRTDQKGFTLLELLIATSIFSTILLLLTFGLIQIGRVYYKGVNSSRTQSALRAIVDNVTQSIQYGGGFVDNTPASTPGPGGYQVCVGNKRYTYVLGYKLGVDDPPSHSKKRVLIVQDISELGGTCTVLATQSDIYTFLAGNNGRELMAPGMRLLQFNVTKILPPTSPEQYTVSVRIGLGDSDLFNDGSTTTEPDWATGTGVKTALCRGGVGQEYCATAELNTVVRKRLL